MIFYIIKSGSGPEVESTVFPYIPPALSNDQREQSLTGSFALLEPDSPQCEEAVRLTEHVQRLEGLYSNQGQPPHIAARIRQVRMWLSGYGLPPEQLGMVRQPEKVFQLQLSEAVYKISEQQEWNLIQIRSALEQNHPSRLPEQEREKILFFPTP